MFYNIRIKHTNKYTYLNKLLYLCTINLKAYFMKPKSVWNNSNSNIINDIFYINQKTP